jgi:hypothetical protein
MEESGLSTEANSLDQALIIRTATGDDAADVANVYLRSRKQFLPYAPLAHSDDEVRVWVREVLIPSNNVIVAERGSAILGM